jgi:hypothetical protein
LVPYKIDKEKDRPDPLGNIVGFRVMKTTIEVLDGVHALVTKPATPSWASFLSRVTHLIEPANGAVRRTEVPGALHPGVQPAFYCWAVIMPDVVWHECGARTRKGKTVPHFHVLGTDLHIEYLPEEPCPQQFP